MRQQRQTPLVKKHGREAPATGHESSFAWATCPMLLCTLFLLTMFLSCSNEPRLQPRAFLQGDDIGDNLYLNAPHILVVKITAADITDEEQHVFLDYELKLRLVEYSAEVENVLKGEEVGANIRFFFYANTGQNPSRPLFEGRFVVFLRKERGVYRTMTDHWERWLQVYSGRHDQDDLPRAREVRDLIAYILLHPGSDFDAITFRQGLPVSLGRLTFASRSYVASLMSELQTQPDDELRRDACIEMAMRLGIRPACLSTSLEGAKISELERESLMNVDDTGTIAMLQASPFPFMSPAEERRIAEDIQVYLFDARPSVRNAACKQLKRLWPETDFPSCD